jgi:cytochrome c-type biogenesis protein CcmH
MTLWLILFLMTAAAIFAVLWPLSRRPEAARGGQDVAVYRDQLDEVERDRAAGLIGPGEAEAAKVEISRRLLAAADQSGRPTTDAASALRHRRMVVVAAFVLVPVIAVALYARFGSPQQPGSPLASRPDLPVEQRSIESMVAQVESHLERNPEDGRGWEVVAPVYLRLGRFPDAVRARANALRLLGATATREADLGEAQVALGNGVVTAEAKASFERALKLDPNEAKAQYFTGLAAEQDGRAEEAARLWRDMLARAAPNAPYRPLIEQSLARLQGKDGEKVASAELPGPAAEDLQAAEQLTPEQRAAMVRGMVERLAEKLKTDGSDFDGWVRLVRAYVVMGDAEKARAALSEARKAMGGDADKRGRLDEFAKSLGIDS